MNEKKKLFITLGLIVVFATLLVLLSSNIIVLPF